jgi:hypothetical protein
VPWRTKRVSCARRRAPHDEYADEYGKSDNGGGETPGECDSLILIAAERVDQECRAEQG